MENIIEYYYNIKIDNIKQKENNYLLKVKKSILILKEIYDLEAINNIYDLSINPNINTIIPNKDNNLFTNINNKLYSLILLKRVYILTLSNISNLSNTNTNIIPKLERNNWEVLWSNRIDFLEEFISQNNNKYPLIRESSDYFIGLTENAISYLVNTKRDLQKDNYLDRKVISHISLSNSLYDPFNIIFDHKARDIAEYIKYSFLTNNTNIYIELDTYFKHNNYSKYGIQLLYSRILYPNYYFNIIDKIITNKLNEYYLDKIIDKVDEYEKYLYNIYLYLSKYYDIPIPLWLKKNKEFNPHL